MAQEPFPRDITFTWSWPTHYDDNSAIQSGDLKHARITCEAGTGSFVIDVEIPITTPLGSTQTETLVGAIPAPGTYTCFEYAVTANDISSLASNAAIKIHTGSGVPKAIINFTVD